MLSCRLINKEAGAAMLEFAMVAGAVAFTIAVPLVVFVLPKYQEASDNIGFDKGSFAARDSRFYFAADLQNGDRGAMCGAGGDGTVDNSPLNAVAAGLSALSGLDAYCVRLLTNYDGAPEIGLSSDGCEALGYEDLYPDNIQTAFNSMNNAGQESVVLVTNSNLPGRFSFFPVSALPSNDNEGDAGCPRPTGLVVQAGDQMYEQGEIE